MSSELPTGWRKIRIDEVADVVGGGTPSTRIARNFGGEIPWITPKDLSGWEQREIEAGNRSLSQEGLAASSARLLPEKAVLLSTRAPIGHVAIAGRPVSTSQGFRSLVLKPGHIPEFFYYLLKDQKELLEGRAGGSTFRELSGTALKQTEFLIPPLEEQERIGWVLASLDDKLANSRRIVRISEELLTLRFKTQFACTQSGWDGLNAAMVSDGWRLSTVGDVLQVVGGSTPSTTNEEYWSGGTHCWATPKDLSSLRSPVLLDTARHLTDAGLERVCSGPLPVGTVLISSRAPIGYSAIAGVQLAVNQGFIAVLPSERLSSAFILFWLRHNLEQIKSHAGGTTFAEIGKRAFRQIPMAVPPQEALTEFERFARPLLNLVAEREAESRTLSELRDRLLPGLISGRIQVSRGQSGNSPVLSRKNS